MPDHRTDIVTADLDGLVTLAHIIYALHAFAVVTGVLGSATIIGSFVASLPSILAVVLNYMKRGAVRGTWLESHFRWQIRTFWFALLWILVAAAMAVTLIGIPFAFVLLAGAGLWIAYRVIRGWLNLLDRSTMPMPSDA
ncbi:hypothetical protein LLG90_02280 [Aromatoleum toluclasticum]|uniref:DUF4870 family protein n=1 Tax=Aromatoleum toluclasticum TaxID=92003 RepID=UPI001D1809EC|nr:hypothetical protein [Aromatoleum toluclasticum]MCC4114170.1 hypothetical protein [Aromatoleum toluclasticum]